MSQEQQTQQDGFESVESALSRTELFIEENKSIISYAIIGIVVLVAAYFGFQRFVSEPRNNEAASTMYVAEQYFQKDSFNLALNGDGNNYGFLDVIDNYGGTKAGKLAQYYAGISYMYLGQYEEAIAHLKKFNAKDIVLSSIAKGAMGDAYVELGNIEKGASCYEAAAANSDNKLTAPLYLYKAAVAYEKAGKSSKALSLYKKIKADYAESTEARQVEKSIEKLSK